MPLAGTGRALRAACMVLAVVAAGASPAAAKTRAAKMVAAMDATYTQYKDGLVGLCLGAVDEQTRRIRCYGRRAAGSAQAPDRDSLFGIASVTKTFTATLLAADVVRHRVRLGAPVRKFIAPTDGKVNYPANVTLRDLAQHYSGIRRDAGDVADFHELYRRAGECLVDPSCAVSAPTYSNFAYDVLGIILGRRDGFSPQPLPSGYVMPPWEPDLQQQVLAPLDLHHTATYVGWDRANKLPYYNDHIAQGTTVDGQPYSMTEIVGSPVTDASGALTSSPHDMLRWLRYSMFGAKRGVLKKAFFLLHRRTRIQRPINATTQIGLAWNVDHEDGFRVVNKAGKLKGYVSFVSFLQDRPRGVFVLANNVPADFAAADISCTLMRALPPDNAGIPCPAADDGATTTR
jgi:CubicO group peptidase (beta-lactamase class C family)